MTASRSKKRPDRGEGLSLANIEDVTREIRTIPVQLSYEIIHLFSEGLYQSPQKAIEELVSNGYDAAASSVHIVLPPSEGGELSPLWVIDDGSGMDADGFSQLWRVANSKKTLIDATTVLRAPIGQFGIGKLASYVLAWRLTHISRYDGTSRFTSMDFRRLDDRHQFDQHRPFDLQLRELSENQAQELLREVQERDPAAWERMFGTKRSSTWTAAALSDFKDLYSKLSIGRLGWVLSTGLPLHSDFTVWLNGEQLQSSKESMKEITSFAIGGPDDEDAEKLGLTTTVSGVLIPGIDGEITGRATIHEKKLTEGKSDNYGRSNGFFIRVRDRVINLEDPLFGLPALNHAAWSRFHMELNAEGLRALLLSSREGVRESDAVRTLRQYMQAVFNSCRRAYDEWLEKEKTGIDIQSLLGEHPSAFVTDPSMEGIRRALDAEDESYYVALPNTGEKSADAWLQDFETKISEDPFDQILYERTGVHDRVVRYVPDTRTLIINIQHPFIEKLLETGKTRAAATLFGSAELMVDLLMQEHGFSRSAIIDLLVDRDRILRLVAGDEPSTAAEVLRLLESSKVNETALERAVGMAFRVLGFEYERRGGFVPGADGVLYARLGRGQESLSDYKVVYDSKQSNSGAVAAAKINLDSLNDFRVQENADYGFFLAVDYENQLQPDGKLNRLVSDATAQGRKFTMLRADDLRRLVELHYTHGVTLTRLRGLFEDAHTTPEVIQWIDDLTHELTQQEPQVPLFVLLDGLEEAKNDEMAKPNVYSVRAVNPDLKRFTPERLTAALRAVETIIGNRWIEVESGGDVTLHNTASQIVAEVERNLRELLGVNAMKRSPVQ